jgi:hypothetical protein
LTDDMCRGLVCFIYLFIYLVIFILKLRSVVCILLIRCCYCVAISVLIDCLKGN